MNDQDRKKAAAAIFTAAAEGKACQRAYFFGSLSSDTGVTDWKDSDPFQCLSDVSTAPQYWRVKPEPKTRPWTFEEAPFNLRVIHTRMKEKAVAKLFPDGFAVFWSVKDRDSEDHTFASLLADFTQLDGTPCGVTE